jgi:hypothetical protein
MLQLWQKVRGPDPWESFSFSRRTGGYAGSLLALAWFTSSLGDPFIYFHF